MKAKKVKRFFVVALMFFLMAVLCFAAPQGEDANDGDDQTELPLIIEMLLETPSESTEIMGFGIIADLSHLSDKDREGLQVELDPIYREDYLDNPKYFGEKAKKAEHPMLLLFNLDINYGKSNRSFDVTKAQNGGIILYIIQKGFRLGLGKDPAIYYLVKEGGIERWYSHKEWLSYQEKYINQPESLDMFLTEFDPESKNGVSWFEIRKWPANDRIIGVDER